MEDQWAAELLQNIRGLAKQVKNLGNILEATTLLREVSEPQVEEKVLAVKEEKRNVKSSEGESTLQNIGATLINEETRRQKRNKKKEDKAALEDRRKQCLKKLDRNRSVHAKSQRKKSSKGLRTRKKRKKDKKRMVKEQQRMDEMYQGVDARLYLGKYTREQLKKKVLKKAKDVDSRFFKDRFKKLG